MQLKQFQKRFGHLVAAHRHARGWTQHELASAAEVSEDMIARIEIGGTGARFPTIVRLASALRVDPAEFFTTDVAKSRLAKPQLIELSAKLARLSDNDLQWVDEVIDVVLRRPR